MTRQRTIPADDEAAFREAVKDVQPLPDAGRVAHARPRPVPLPRQRQEDDRQVLADSLSSQAEGEPDLESGDMPAYLREGIGPQVLRKLRSGFWAVQDELDLHGLRSEEARELLLQFLATAGKRGYRCLRVIHGKGWRSKNREPVLKPRVASWLMQRRDVLAFCEARAADGGAGAVVVLLQAQGARHEARENESDATP